MGLETRRCIHAVALIFVTFEIMQKKFVQNSICKCFWKQVGKNKKKGNPSLSLPPPFSACRPSQPWASPLPFPLSSDWQARPTCHLPPPATAPSFSHARSNHLSRVPLLRFPPRPAPWPHMRSARAQAAFLSPIPRSLASAPACCAQ